MSLLTRKPITNSKKKYLRPPETFIFTALFIKWVYMVYAPFIKWWI